MIEQVIIDYLNKKLSVPTYMEYPAKKPPAFVVIEKVGGGEKNFLNKATITLQSNAPTLEQAALLNKEVKKQMNLIIELPRISKSKLNSDYNFTDSDTKKYRYQAVYDIVYC
nr:MAG TPA: tail completion protein [Caudoviricetes sp.]